MGHAGYAHMLLKLDANKSAMSLILSPKRFFFLSIDTKSGGGESIAMFQ